MTFEILVTAFLDQFINTKLNKPCTADLDSYLTKIDEKSLSHYFTSPGVLNVAKIRREVTEYICSLYSYPVKRDTLEAIFKLWAFLYSSGKIPLNPLEGMDREVLASEESRRLKLIESIRAEPRTIEQLQQILWVSERTLQSILGDLQEGKGLFPWEIEVQTKNKKVYYFCRVNPVFLAFNVAMNTMIKMSQN